MLCDILWSDPRGPNDPGDEDEDFAPNERGVSYTFTKAACDHFCSRNNIDLICRGHLVVDAGYEFYADRKLVTIFSAPNYCGLFENDGCMMKIGADLTCSFMLLKP